MTIEFKPKPVGIEDIDLCVYDWFESKNVIFNNGSKETKLPIIWLTQERWHEYQQTWKILDNENNQNIKPPYITIRQKEVAAPAKVRYRIPNKKFTTYRVSVTTTAGLTYDLYSVPQPVKTDIEYEFRFVSHYVEDKNYINELMLNWFSSRQSYIHVHETYYMPLVMDSSADESQVEDANQERLMMTTYTIMAEAFIIDEKEFEIIKGTPRVIVFSEIVVDGDTSSDDNTGYSKE